MDEPDNDRSIAVGLIWLGAGFAIGLTNVNSGDINFFNMVISVFMALGALGATYFLLGGLETFKAKRDTASSNEYSNLLLQLMSDDEKKAVRSRLINNVTTDGEIFAHDDTQKERATSKSS